MCRQDNIRGRERRDVFRFMDSGRKAYAAEWAARFRSGGTEAGKLAAILRAGVAYEYLARTDKCVVSNALYRAVEENGINCLEKLFGRGGTGCLRTSSFRAGNTGLINPREVIRRASEHGRTDVLRFFLCTTDDTADARFPLFPLDPTTAACKIFDPDHVRRGVPAYVCAALASGDEETINFWTCTETNPRITQLWKKATAADTESYIVYDLLCNAVRAYDMEATLPGVLRMIFEDTSSSIYCSDVSGSGSGSGEVSHKRRAILDLIHTNDTRALQQMVLSGYIDVE